MRGGKSESQGFTLIETLVALAIAGMLMLAASSIYWQQREVGRRLGAQRAADRALENAYEMLRLGALPLVDSSYPTTSEEGPTIVVDVSSTDMPGLRQVDLVAMYRVRGHPFRRTLAALIYAP